MRPRPVRQPASRRRAASALAVAFAVAGIVAAARTASAEGPSTTPGASPGTTRPALIPPTVPADAGRELFSTSCVSCHGVDGRGTDLAPSLQGAGEASADFMLRTGRMPMAAPAIQPPVKPVAYTDTEIRQLVAYVGTLGKGPPIPDVDPGRGSLDDGGRLFLANCAPCHNSSAVGGALSYGRHAPSLQETPAVQVAEAIRTGPGQMPRFGDTVFSDEDVDSIVRYVEYLHVPDAPGGLPLGYTGPVSEGFVALLFGLAGLVFVIRWITREPAPLSAPPLRGAGQGEGDG